VAHEQVPRVAQTRGGSIYQKYRRYIADIDIIGIVSYRRFRYRFFRYVNIISVTSEISVISEYFITLFRIFNINLKTNNYVSKIGYLILAM